MRVSRTITYILINIIIVSCSSNNVYITREPAQKLINSSSRCINLLGSLFVHTNLASNSIKTFMYDDLLKSKLLLQDSIIPRDDLSKFKLQEINSFFINDIAKENMSFNERFNLLKNFLIENIVAAPGHRFLRKPQQISGLVTYLKETPTPDFSQDKILINIVTDTQGRINSVDLWNAHHRLVAFIEAGRFKIGDLGSSNLDLLVNGITVHGEKWSHYLSSSGVHWENVISFNDVTADELVREGTIAVSGTMSNFRLGSRNTLKQLHRNVFSKEKKRMKIGVYFGTFNPVHEGHIRMVKFAVNKLGLDEVLIVPNVNPVHKNPLDIRHRNAMLSLRIMNEQKLNLFLGDSSEIIDRYGRNPFFERVIQTY